MGLRSAAALAAAVLLALLLVLALLGRSRLDPADTALANEPVDVGHALLPRTAEARPVAIAVGPDSLCWAEETAGRIRCADRDGSGVRVVAAVDRPQGVAIDVAAQRLFWTTDGTYPRRIGWSPLAAGEPAVAGATLWSGVAVHRPRAIAFDAGRGRVLWSETVSGRLRRARLPDGSVTDLVTSGFDVEDRADSAEMRILGLAVLDDGALLWSDMAREEIVRAAADGSDRASLLAAADGITVPAGVAIDTARDLVYWADAARGEILRAALAGGAPQVVAGIAQGLIEPRGVAFDGATDTLLWTDAARDVIGRMDVADGRIDELALAALEAGFLRVPERADPERCDDAGSQVAAARARKAVRICWEKVDTHHAVKVRHADVAPAARICIDQLHRLHRERGAWARCLPAGEREAVWRAVAARERRAAWWIDEVRPFVAAAQHPHAGDAVAVLDEIAAALARDAVAKPMAQGGVHASGQHSPYAARRARAELVAVPDDGTLRAGAPLRFVDNRDGTITDSATGMMWEKKCDGCGGLHDFHRQARWSSPHDETVWDWLDAVNDEDGRGFAGHRDWRLPHVKELQSIVDYERFNPSVASAFDGPLCGLGCVDLTDPDCSCTETSEYWTATTTAPNAELAFFVGFHLGLIGDLEKSDDLPMRAVRGGRLPVRACRDPLDADGASPLLHALLDANVAQARRLLAAGADPNCRTELRVRLIAARGADVPDGVPSVEATPLLVAAFVGDPEIIRLLVAHGADLDAPTDDGNRALHLAAIEGRDEAVAALLRAGATVDAPGEHGKTALHVAAANGHDEIVPLLLAAGANPNHADARGVTPLIAAIEHGATDLARVLLASGAAHDAGVSAHGLPAFLLATAVADPEIVAALLERNADPNARHRVSSDALADHGIDIESGRQVEVTPLLIAAHQGNIEIAELLLLHGADPSAVGTDGVSPLFASVGAGNADMAAWLLAHGAAADADEEAHHGQSPLVVAVEQAHVELAHVLLAAGADANRADALGVTPMHAARERGNDEMVALLRRFGAAATTAEDRVLRSALVDTVGFDPRFPAAAPQRAEPRGIAVDPAGGWVYWTEYAGNAIRRVRLDGSGVETVVDHRAEGPIGLALGDGGETLFWTSDAAYPRRVRALEIATGAPTTIAEGVAVHRPRAIAADAGSVFWTEAINGRVRRVAGVGAPVEEIFDDGISSFGDRPDFRHFLSLGLAAAAGRLYWTDAAGAEVVSALPDGSERRVLYGPRDGVDMPAGIAVDGQRGHLYWADVARESILRAPLAGGRPEVVLDADDGLVEPRAVAVDAADGRLYWTDVGRDELGRSTLDGENVEVLRLGAATARGFAPRSTALPGCDDAVREAAATFVRRAVKRSSACLEKVDAFKAVKRAADDARKAAATCAGQLAGLHPGGVASLEVRLAELVRSRCEGRPAASAAILGGCGVSAPECAHADCALAACRAEAWRQTARRFLRAAEWLREVRPFVGVEATAADRDRAIAVLDEGLAAIGSPALPANGAGGLPRTGMTTSYRAVRAGSAEGAAVADDAALAIGRPLQFVDNRDGTITDAVTGLMWEKKCDGCGGLHDVREAYPWIGDRRGQTVWDWLTAVNREGGAGLAGYGDWRIPNVKELQSIVDYEVFNPAVSRDFHGDLCGLGCRDLANPACSCTQMSAYWTSTTYGDSRGRAFVLMFNLGIIGDRGKDERAHVRAVRGGVPEAARDSAGEPLPPRREPRVHQ